MGLMTKKFHGRGKTTAKANKMMPTTTKRRYREKEIPVSDARRIVQGDTLMDNLMRVNEDLAEGRKRAEAEKEELGAQRKANRKRIGMLAFETVKRRVAKEFATA